MKLVEEFQNCNRVIGLQKLTVAVTSILKRDLASRTDTTARSSISIHGDDQTFFMAGLFAQRNTFTSKLCLNWSAQQLLDCTRKFQYIAARPLTKIFSFGDPGSSVFVILRGSVRIFKHQRFGKIYDQDLFPGEIFGEAVLDGSNVRDISAFSVAPCEFAVLEVEDYRYINSVTVAGASKDKLKGSTESNFNFLMEVPIFKGVELQKLSKIASVLTHVHFAKDKPVIEKGHRLSGIHFIVSGKVHVVPSIGVYVSNASHLPISGIHPCSAHIITTMNALDYFGEADALNYTGIDSHVIEVFDAIAGTSVDCLVLPLNQVYLLDDLLTTIKTNHRKREAWHRERYSQMQKGDHRLTEYDRAHGDVSYAPTTNDVKVHMGIVKGDNDKKSVSINALIKSHKKPDLSALPVDINKNQIIRGTIENRTMALHTTAPKANAPGPNVHVKLECSGSGCGCS